MDNNAKNWMENKKYWIFGSFVLIIIVLVLAFYAGGYRLKNNLTIGKIGKVKIEIPISGTIVFIDESKKIITNQDKEILALNLSPKEHSIIVSREGYLPWTKKVDVPSGGEKILEPLFITSNASGVIINKADPDYYTIRNSIIKNISPTKDNPAISKNGKTKLWLEDNAIFVQTGSSTKKVIQPDTIIRNVSFYKDRDDVVIFSNQSSVYAIEVDTTGIQNFMPIYRGQNPNFINANEISLYVLDSETLMQVNI